MNVLVAGMFRYLKTEWEVRMIAMSVGVQNRQRCSCYLVYFVSFVDSVGSTAKKAIHEKHEQEHEARLYVCFEIKEIKPRERVRSPADCQNSRERRRERSSRGR